MYIYEKEGLEKQKYWTSWMGSGF